MSLFYDSSFNDTSYGFRPGRCAHQVVLQAQDYLDVWYIYVVELDLERFFNKVNHGKQMTLLSHRINNKALLKLIRRYLCTSSCVTIFASLRKTVCLKEVYATLYIRQCYRSGSCESVSSLYLWQVDGKEFSSHPIWEICWWYYLLLP